jgi:hypothetical protein
MSQEILNGTDIVCVNIGLLFTNDPEMIAYAKKERIEITPISRKFCWAMIDAISQDPGLSEFANAPAMEQSTPAQEPQR